MNAEAKTLPEQIALDYTDTGECRFSYAALVHHLRELVQIAGLGQALAYLKTLETPEAQLLRQHLNNWGTRDKKFAGSDLLESLVRRNSGFSEEATREIIRYLGAMAGQLSR